VSSKQAAGPSGFTHLLFFFFLLCLQLLWDASGGDDFHWLRNHQAAFHPLPSKLLLSVVASSVNAITVETNHDDNGPSRVATNDV
jgi:hypothetical protein